MCIGWLVCTSKKGGQRVGRTCGGSTSKRHAVEDGNGVPLAVVLSDGRCHEVTRAIATVESIRIGCLHRRPHGLAADRATIAGNFATIYLCEAYGTVSRNGRRQREDWDGLQPFSGLSSNRWKVERFFAWLDNFRRLATRFERHCMMHLGFIQLVCVMILLRNVLN